MKNAQGHILCECEHENHFRYEDTGIRGADHVYQARVTHVIRAGYGIYQCAACDKAGHSPNARPRLDFVNHRGE